MAADGEVRVQIKADIADFEKALKKAKALVQEFDKSVTSASSSSLKRFSDSTKEASTAANKLKDRIKKTGEANKTASEQIKKTAESAKKLAAAEKGATDAAKGLADSKKRATSESKRFNDEIKKLVAEQRKASQETKRLNSEIKKLASAEKRASGEIKRLTAANKKASDEVKKLKDSIKRTSTETGKFTTKTRKGKKSLTAYQKALKGAATNAALLTGPLGGIASRLTILSQITTKAALVTVGLGLAIGGIALGFKKAIGEAEKFQRSGFKVQAVLRATGNSAGVTAMQIRELSEEIAASTLASVGGVEAAATKLLTFNAISGKVFTDALRLSQDLAEVGFGSVESASVLLGKALQEPATGISALTRVGVTFTAVQKQQIKLFTETNKLAKAQAIIIETVNKQVGGVGVEAAQGLSGAYDSLGQAVNKLFQNIGEGGGLKLMTGLINTLTASVMGLNAVFFPSPDQRLQDLLKERIKLQAILARQQRMFPSAGDFVGRRDRKELAEVNEEIRAIQNKREKEIRARSAAEKAAVESSKRRAKDATAGKAIEARQKEAERLAKLRKTTMRGLTEETRALQQLATAFIGTSLSARDFAVLQEKVRTLSKLSLDETTKQGVALSEEIEKRFELTRAIEAEQSQRERTRSNKEQLAAAQDEIVAAQMLADAVGKSAEEIRKAKVASSAYLIEQEMLTEAFREQQALSSTQVKAIRAQSQALAEAAAKLEDVQTAQQNAIDAEEEANSKRLEFQETIASGLAAAIFEADSFSDALKKMVLNLSRAIVEAKILQAIQFSMGTDTGGAAAGGGNAVGGLLNKAFSGITSIFSPTETVAVKRLHQGGTTGQTINSPVSNFISAPRFHNGLKPDEFPAILQQGEEVIPKDQVGNRGRGDSTVNFFVTTQDANSFRASKRQVSRMLRQQTAAI